MLIRLSIKNIRKSIKDYAIYFLHWYWVSVSFMYSMRSKGSLRCWRCPGQSQIPSIRWWAISSMSIVVSLILGFLIVVCQPLSDEKKKPGIWNLSDTWNEKKAILQRFFSVRRSWSEQSR